MDIIIDSNIIRQDLKLNDKNFEILIDYLAKTNSRLIYPSIVIEEVKGLYKRALTEKKQEFNTSLRRYKSTLLSIELPEIPEIDINDETDKYINYIHNKLGTSLDNVINYKNEYLPELVNRAIKRKKPLDNKGQQFRDGILWLTLLDYAESTKEKRVAFISNNSNDFAEKGENKLCSELIEETANKGIDLKYFKTLNDFAKEHASVIDFITKKWVENNIDLKIIEKLFDEILDSSIEEAIIDGANLESNEKPTGYINKTDYFNSKLIEFFVYEKSDGTILLNLEYEFEAEYEIEIERVLERDTSRYAYRYSTNPHTGEPEMDMDFIPDYSIEQEQDYELEYPLFKVNFVLTIIDKKVSDYKLKDWDWG